MTVVNFTTFGNSTISESQVTVNHLLNIQKGAALELCQNVNVHFDLINNGGLIFSEFDTSINLVKEVALGHVVAKTLRVNSSVPQESWSNTQIQEKLRAVNLTTAGALSSAELIFRRISFEEYNCIQGCVTFKRGRENQKYILQDSNCRLVISKQDAYYEIEKQSIQGSGRTSSGQTIHFSIENVPDQKPLPSEGSSNLLSLMTGGLNTALGGHSYFQLNYCASSSSSTVHESGFWGYILRKLTQMFDGRSSVGASDQAGH